MNTYIDDFIVAAKNRLRITNGDQLTYDWLAANTVIRGKPYSVDNYKFQEAILNDVHPNLVVIKCSQVGVSELNLRKGLAFVKRNKGVNLIYTLPDDDMYTRFSQTRVKPCIDENNIFHPADGTRAVRNLSTMQFGSSFFFMMKADEKSATSTPADYLMHDEVDLSDQKALSLFLSRLNNSSFQYRHLFSTPTFSGFGIDSAYEDTDQLEYFCKCHHCGEYNIPDFDFEYIHIPGLSSDLNDWTDLTSQMIANIDMTQAKVVCRHCHKPLWLGDPSREWVPKYPERTNSRGYRVRPFSTGRTSVAYIVSQLLEYKRMDYVRGWYNTTLGRPYMDGNIRLDLPTIEACFGERETPAVDKSYEYSMGIDMGDTCHITLGRKTADGTLVCHFETCAARDIVERVKALCAVYNIVGGAVDRHPYTPTAEEIFAASAGKILPIEYRGSLELNVIEDKLSDRKYGQADRTTMLDAVFNGVRKQTMHFCGYRNDLAKTAIIAHLRDMFRDQRPGGQPAVWRKMTGEDHYFHALAFMQIGFKIANIGAGSDNIDSRTAVDIVTSSITAVNSILPVTQQKIGMRNGRLV